MLPLKREEVDGLFLSNTPPKVQGELDYWKEVEFSFDDMEDKNPGVPDSSRSRSRNPQRSRSSSTAGVLPPGNTSGTDIQDAALLAQFAAAAGSGISSDQSYSSLMLPGQYPSMGPAPGFYGNFLHHYSMANPQLPPLSSLDFPWPQNLPLQQAAPSHFEAHSPSTSAALASMHFGSTQYNPLPPLPDTNRDRQGSHSQPPAASPVSTDADPVDTERNAISEEKRRRNTAASARFRVKKKQKTINLERSVADLTGRAEELEKEVADLRRENGWLKEIVMLKGTRFAAANMSNRLALDQAAALALAGGPPSAEAGPSNSGQHVKTSEEDSEESSGKEEDPRKSRPKSRK